MFTHPWWLLLLIVVGALAAGYVLLLRRRRRDTVRFTNLELLDRVAPRRPGWPRHLPAAALIAALAVLTVALAGPMAEARVPRNRATVVLVIDVSLSMQATDVEPSRLAAAQAAAKSFADQLTPGINLGLVSFAGTAAVLVSPTVDREPVKRAVDGLKLSESTATGEAIFAAMQSVETFSQAIAGAAAEGPPPARIVLMSDGKQTVPGGVMPEEEPRGSFTAARAAAEAGIPVSTISFGTDYGSIEINPAQRPPRTSYARCTPSSASRSVTRCGGSTRADRGSPGAPCCCSPVWAAAWPWAGASRRPRARGSGDSRNPASRPDCARESPGSDAPVARFPRVGELPIG